MRDEDIDLSDIPEMQEEFFSDATLVMPEGKSSITLRLDQEVIEWFKSQGKGYQTRMNAVLKAYVMSQRDGLDTEKCKETMDRKGESHEPQRTRG